tara:strand:+ start:180 stop:2771 length:2592 start_codon:yes stop_codon:yes gene_type:complete
MNQTFKISVHPKHYRNKPADAYNLQKGYTTTDTTLEGLKETVYNGQTIVPSILNNGYRKNSNFSGSQVIFLDFDDNQNPQTEIEKYKEYGINVNMTYNSYSHTPEYNKFRLVIVLDTIIEDAIIYKNVVSALIKVGGSDEACKDVSRMYYAGTNPEVLTEDINQWNEVKGALTDLINKDKKQNHYTRTYKKIDSVKNGVNTYMPIYNIGDCTSTPKLNIQKFNFDRACENSILFNGFDKGTVNLKYAQLRALISNMMFVRGGLKYVKEKMILRGDYKGEDWSLLSRIPNAGYSHAEGMSSFDSSIQDKFHNILDLDNTQRLTMIQTREIIKENVDVVSERMDDFHKKALNSFHRVSIINAPTGTGKSRLMITQPNVIIALPTHKLKDELAERMDAGNLPYVATPNPPEFITKALMDRYDNLQAMEESSLASDLIKSVSDNKDVDGIEYTEEDVLIATEFKSALNEAYESEVTVLTTHSRVMLTPKLFKFKDVVYFDEDIKELLLRQKSVPVKNIMSEISKLVNSSKKGSDFQKDVLMVQAEVSNVTGEVVGTLKTSCRFIDRNGFFSRLASQEGFGQLANLINSAMSRFLVDGDSRAMFYYGEVKGISEVFSKVIIFSGTADKFFYDRIFYQNKEEYDYFHCGFAENLHPIKQDLKKSWSKYTMSKGMFPEVDSDIVITHKKYAGAFEGKEEQDVYFGNTEGVDKYKGLDISVAGVMIEPVNSTVMKALLLGFLTPQVPQKSMQTVDLDYFTFSFFTFEDENLKQIEMRSAMTHLTQAVGRARTTRTDAKVDLHTSLPIPDADIFIGKKLLKSINEELGEISTPFQEKENDEFYGEVMDEVFKESGEDYRQVDLFYGDENYTL